MNKTRIGCSPLTNIIYAGKVNKDGQTWRSGTQQDVTSDVIQAIIHYVGIDKQLNVTLDGKPRYTILIKEII